MRRERASERRGQIGDFLQLADPAALGHIGLDDLDRLYDTVKREKGSIDVLWASAGMGEEAVLGEITEEQFDRAFSLNALFDRAIESGRRRAL